MACDVSPVAMFLHIAAQCASIQVTLRGPAVQWNMDLFDIYIQFVLSDRF